MIRALATLLVLSFVVSARAQPNCVEDSQCKSQLLRVEISNAILNNNAKSLLPALQNFASSSTLPALIEKDFPLKPITFPQSLESCQREKGNLNPLFEKINCEEPGLCGKKDLNSEVKALMCFSLPCTLFEGTLNPGKCGSEASIYPNEIVFPTPVSVTKIEMTPTKVNFENGEATICFRINELQINMGIRLGLDTRGTTLPDSGIDINNIAPTLDGPRDVCLSANVSLGSPTPVSNLKVTPEGSSPFISDEMIREASRKLSISGLSGYPADQLEKVQGEIIPVIFQPLRQTVEDAVKNSLGVVFETEVNKLAGQMAGNSSHLVSSRDLSTELGVANLQMRNQLARTECAALNEAKRLIPPAHPCIGLDHFGKPITTAFSSPTINELMDLKRVTQGLPITSENMKQRLIALKEVLRARHNEYAQPDDPPHFIEGWKEARENDIKEFIDPLIDSISKNQLESQIFNFIEISNQLQSGSNSRNVGVSVPDICSDTRPSPHARREMKDCPVQAYMDLNEMNQVLDRMWKAGRLCHKGRGPFVASEKMYDSEGRPNGEGCYFEVGGMGCYLNNPPQINFDPKTKKYKTSVKLKSCFRGPVMFGLGKLGGDFNIDFSFTPKACNGGDFCMDNPDVNWSVVPGSERFALRPSSPLNGIVESSIQNAINGAIGDAIRIPMASSVGPLASVPLEAEGRVDTGPGFFGACLRLRGSGVSEQ